MCLKSRGDGFASIELEKDRIRVSSPQKTGKAI